MRPSLRKRSLRLGSNRRIWLQILAGATLLILIGRLVTSPLALHIEQSNEEAPRSTAKPPATTATQIVNDPLPEPVQAVEQSIRQAGLGNAGNRQFEASLQRLMLSIAAFPNDSFQKLGQRRPS